MLLIGSPYFTWDEDTGIEAVDDVDSDREGTGTARVYDYNEKTKDWVQRGDDLRGSIPNHFNEDNDAAAFGWSTAISADGDTVAVGASDMDVDGYEMHDTGSVFIFHWDKEKKVCNARGSSSRLRRLTPFLPPSPPPLPSSLPPSLPLSLLLSPLLVGSSFTM